MICLQGDYFNGLHLYWNNEALIYTENKFTIVYEWGMDIKDVKKMRIITIRWTYYTFTFFRIFSARAVVHINRISYNI